MQIIDVSKDPYGQRYYGKKKRQSFEKLKRTVEFKEWRKKQEKIQHNRCAYCRIPFRHRNIVVHVDHIQPLRFDGTNKYDNLLLTCRRCNLKKWIATNRVVPDWVKENKVALENHKRLQEARKEQSRLMRELVSQEIDEQIGDELRQMF